MNNNTTHQAPPPDTQVEQPTAPMIPTNSDDNPRRAGRPRLDDIMKRTNHTYRANYIEMLNIEANQQKAGYADTGEYVREMSQYGKVYARSTPEEVKTHRDFIGLANNVNQLTALAHKYGLKGYVLHRLEQEQMHIDNYIDRLENPHHYNPDGTLDAL